MRFSRSNRQAVGQPDAKRGGKDAGDDESCARARADRHSPPHMAEDWRSADRCKYSRCSGDGDGKADGSRGADGLMHRDIAPGEQRGRTSDYNILDRKVGCRMSPFSAGALA
jgi:hypothetical protein